MTLKTNQINHSNEQPEQAGANFYGLGIAPKILDILEKIKFKVPTPIQQKAIPIAIEGKDIMGIAQTGTGKTLAFAIPMIQRLTNMKGRGEELQLGSKEEILNAMERTGEITEDQKKEELKRSHGEHLPRE